MKHDRNGQAAILTQVQIDDLFAEFSPKWRAVFGTCYYLAPRIGETIQLEARDRRMTPEGERMIFRAATTKTKKSRDLRLSPKLAALLDAAELPDEGYLFPGRNGGHLRRRSADKMLREKCDYLGIEGASTHSFRRTAITNLFRQGVPMRTIQAWTGHASLSNLALYCEVNQAEVDALADLL